MCNQRTLRVNSWHFRVSRFFIVFFFFGTDILDKDLRGNEYRIVRLNKLTVIMLIIYQTAVET